MEINIAQAGEELKKHDNILILTHENPDGDTLGSGFALYYALLDMGKTVSVKNPNVIPQKYSYFVADTPEIAAEYIVSLDIASPQLLGDLREEYQDKIDLCIDHHPSNDLPAKKTLLIATAPAACEIIFDVLAEMDVTITPKIADCLYTGITTDTGCFRYSSTTPHTHEIAAKLITSGAKAYQINNIMFESKTKQRVLLEQAVMGGVEFYFGDKCAVIAVTKEIFENTKVDKCDLDGVSAMPRKIEGVEIAITIRYVSEDKYKISVRTSDKVNATEFCKKFGGGGHAKASGCTIDGTLQDVKKKLIEAAEGVV